MAQFARQRRFQGRWRGGREVHETPALLTAAVVPRPESNLRTGGAGTAESVEDVMDAVDLCIVGSDFVRAVGDRSYCPLLTSAA